MKPLDNLSRSIRQSWDERTCYPVQKKDWTKGNPALGQCAVTALLLQDYLGGKIVFNQANDHFWNILPDGEIIDLTRSQFQHPVDLTVDALCNRDELLHSSEAVKQNTLHRYELLKSRVQSKLSKKNSPSFSRKKDIATSRLPKRKLALQ